MKKLLLIASALLAFTFFGCDQPSNPSSPDTGKSDVVVGDDTTKDDDTTGDDTTGDDTTGEEKPVYTTLLDFSNWKQNTGGYSAAEATVETVNGVPYIKATTKADWNNMIYVSGKDLSNYSKLFFDVFAKGENAVSGRKLVVEFLENTEGWPAIGSTEIDLPQTEPLSQSIIFDLSNTQWKKFDMIKVFVKDDSNTLFVSDVYISSIKVQ